MFGLLFQKNDKTIDFETQGLESAFDFIHTDIHSHLLPSIDDGVKTPEESFRIVNEFLYLGYQKMIFTPHIKSDVYRNTREMILDKYEKLLEYFSQNNLHTKIEVAAEYYLDEWFMAKIERKEALLTFSSNLLLFETSFQQKPMYLFDNIKKIQDAGYQPVMAHPERYVYLQKDFDLVYRLKETNIHLQTNLNSFVGYYGKEAQTLAGKLLEQSLVNIVGSDCHGERHLTAMKTFAGTKYYKLLKNAPLLNPQF